MAASCQTPWTSVTISSGAWTLLLFLQLLPVLALLPLRLHLGCACNAPKHVECRHDHFDVGAQLPRLQLACSGQCCVWRHTRSSGLPAPPLRPSPACAPCSGTFPDWVVPALASTNVVINLRGNRWAKLHDLATYDAGVASCYVQAGKDVAA